MKKIREMMKSRKGFTLVEIIVVLVILAILAAFTIPAMLGYVNSAKEKAHLAEARTCLIAAQATIDEYASQDNVKINDVTAAIVAGAAAEGDSAKFFTKYTSYINGDTSLVCKVLTADTNGKIDTMTVTGTDYYMTYTPAGGWVYHTGAATS